LLGSAAGARTLPETSTAAAAAAEAAASASGVSWLQTGGSWS
jgi:hypothetical protein